MIIMISILIIKIIIIIIMIIIIIIIIMIMVITSRSLCSTSKAGITRTRKHTNRHILESCVLLTINGTN